MTRIRVWECWNVMTSHCFYHPPVTCDLSPLFSSTLTRSLPWWFSKHSSSSYSFSSLQAQGPFIMCSAVTVEHSLSPAHTMRFSSSVGRRDDENRVVWAHQRRSSFADFTNATVVGPIRKSNRSNFRRMVCAGRRHLSHQLTNHS